MGTSNPEPTVEAPAAPTVDERAAPSLARLEVGGQRASEWVEEAALFALKNLSHRLPGTIVYTTNHLAFGRGYLKSNAETHQAVFSQLQKLLEGSDYELKMEGSPRCVYLSYRYNFEG